MKNDPRSCERNLCNCVKKPENKIRTSTGFEPVTSQYRSGSFFIWFHFRSSLVHDSFHIHHSHSSFWLEHMNPQLTCPNVSGFIAQLVRASHRYREVTGSNPVEVLNFFIKCVHNCEDHSSFDFISAVHIWFISCTSFSEKYCNTSTRAYYSIIQ